MIRLTLLLFSMLFFIGCASKQPILSQSATILIKTPTMKYYDKGFITQYPYYTQVQIYGAGQTVLDLQIYDDRICQSTFECQSLESFNATYLHPSYEKGFLKALFKSKDKEVIHRNRDRGILIKIRKD